jgi:hypothetical protein
MPRNIKKKPFDHNRFQHIKSSHFMQNIYTPNYWVSFNIHEVIKWKYLNFNYLSTILNIEAFRLLIVNNITRRLKRNLRVP